MEDSKSVTMEETEHNSEAPETEVAPALIAVHPSQDSVAVAVGSDLRVFDLREGSPVSLGTDSSECVHKDSIRAIRYGAKGKIFVSAGDDKVVKVWSTETWRCIYSVPSEKKVSAVAISDHGEFVCFADKFGVVWVVDLDEFHENQALVDKKALPLFGHYCSIITSLEFSPDGKFIITADRDFKIRVTVFPKKPLDGAHEIQSFCLGHTEFVSSLAFVCSQDHPQGFLVSGSGDSTVRLWDFTTGSLLHTCEVASEVAFTRSPFNDRNSKTVLKMSKAGLLQSNGKEHSLIAVTDLCATADGSLIAVAIQSLPGILMLSCDMSAKTLSVLRLVSVSGEAFIPTSLALTSSSGLLWMVMGVSNLHNSDSASLARVRIMSGFRKSGPEPDDNNPTMVADTEVPGGEQLLQQLQGSLSIDKEVFLAAADAVKTSMHNLLIKKQYSTERREFRKRGRNDRKVKR